MTRPPHIRADQVKGFARAAGRVALAMSAGWWARPIRQGPDRASAGPDPASASPEMSAERAAWIRFLAAYIALDERRADFVLSPNDLTAEQVRWAEVELEDAIAVAGEFEVHDLPWSLA